MQKNSFKIFCLSAKKIRWGTLRCFRKFRVSKNFMHKKGISLFSVEIFLSHSAKKIRRGILLYFEKILVSKMFMHHDFPSKMFSLTVPTNFAGEPFCVSENFWYRKLLWIRGVEDGGVTIRNRKDIWHDRDANPGPAASEPCCPNPTAVIYF